MVEAASWCGDAVFQNIGKVVRVGRKKDGAKAVQFRLKKKNYWKVQESSGSTRRIITISKDRATMECLRSRYNHVIKLGMKLKSN